CRAISLRRARVLARARHRRARSRVSQTDAVLSADARLRPSRYGTLALDEEVQADAVMADAARQDLLLARVSLGAEVLLHRRDRAEQVDFERRAVVAFQQPVAKTQVLRQGEVPVEIDRLSAVGQPIELPFGNRLADPQFGNAFERRHNLPTLPARPAFPPSRRSAVPLSTLPAPSS